ncbi:MAG: hypothetical protein MMC23_007941 [Stictis urceolatum]|nr:hypothetical protein [Stictis urceolata]
MPAGNEPDMLSSLLLELLFLIGNGLPSDALRFLAQTCKRVQATIEQQLYKDVQLSSNTRLLALLSAIESNPSRAAYLKRLHLVYERNTTTQGQNFQPSTLAQLFKYLMINLRKLIFGIHLWDDENYYWLPYAELQLAGSPSLRQLTLRNYTLKAFFYPRSLTKSFHLQRPFHLRLLDSNHDMEDLKHFMGFVGNLTQFSYYRPLYACSRSHSQRHSFAADFVDALSPAQACLESMTFKYKRLWSRANCWADHGEKAKPESSPPASLAAFTKLKYLRVSAFFLRSRAKSSTDGWEKVKQRMPPLLEVLALEVEVDNKTGSTELSAVVLTDKVMERKDNFASRLKKVVLHMEEDMKISEPRRLLRKRTSGWREESDSTMKTSLGMLRRMKTEHRALLTRRICLSKPLRFCHHLSIEV